MGRNTRSYGNRSLVAMCIMLLTTQNYYPSMHLAVDLGETAGWLLFILGGAFSSLLLWPVVVALRRRPGETLYDLLRAALGKVGATLFTVAFVGTLVFLGGMIVRETSEMAISSAFPHTPQTFATTALLVGATYVAWGDSSSVVRLGRLLLVPLVISLALVVVGTSGWANLRYLQPIWGPGPLVLLTNTPPMAAFYAPAMCMAVLAGGLARPMGLTRWAALAPLISGCGSAIVKVILLSIYPYPASREVAFPLHYAARLVIGGRFFERLEGVWLFVWVVTTIIFLGGLLHSAAQTYASAFGMRQHNLAVLPLAALMLTTAFFPPDQATTMSWHLHSAWWVFVATLLLPSTAALIALLRRRWARLAG